MIDLHFQEYNLETCGNLETLPALENKVYGAHQSDEMRCRQQYFGQSI
jgi:hypothetical protein